MQLVVLCDFDGTITTLDTAEWVLSKYASYNWRVFDKQFERGEITLEECLNKQFSLVKASKNQILKELEFIVAFREGFKEFAEFCRNSNIPLVIVSAGLDFVIEHFLRKNSVFGLVEICTAKTGKNAEGFRFRFPKVFGVSSQNFKPDVVRFYRERKFKVVFIGDGLADYAAVKKSDFSFAIQGSNLWELCKKHGTSCIEINSFQDLISPLSEIKAQGED
jgi:2-hydroxy-3-keto-5-methylthiopentenyl-1-phosphate phosphatase